MRANIVFTLTGADHEGLIHEIAHHLSQRDINIESMDTPQRARRTLSSGNRMAYTLEALVTRSLAASEAVKQFPSARAVPLAQGVSLIPLIPDLLAELQTDSYWLAVRQSRFCT